MQGKRLDGSIRLSAIVVGVGELENRAIVDGGGKSFAERVHFAVRMHGRRVDLWAFNLSAAVLGQGEDDLVEGGNGGVAEAVTGEGLSHAQANDNGFDFIWSEHEGGEFKGAVEAVANACLALHGNPGEREIANVAIDSSLGDGQQFCKLRGGGEPPRTQVLHDLEKPIGAAHAETIAGAAASGVGVQAHAVSFCVDEVRVGAHAGRKLGARQDDFAAGLRDAGEHGIEGRVGVEVDDGAFSRRLEAGACDEGAACGVVAIVGEDGE